MFWNEKISNHSEKRVCRINCRINNCYPLLMQEEGFCKRIILYEKGGNTMVIWPKNKKIAVVLTFDFDGETYWIGKNERSTKVFANLSRGQYGPHEGIYRVLNMLDELEVKGTFFVPGYIAETYQDQVKMIHEKGHEIGYHGYMHEQKRGISREEELARMEKCEAILAGITGKKPVGHRGPGGIIHPFTMEMIAERGYLYSSNMKDTNSPYIHEVAGKKIVELPTDEYYDDATYYWFSLTQPVHRDIVPPETVNECWGLDFEQLLDEPGSIMVLHMHPQLIGRAGRIRALGEFVGYMKAHGAWIATGEEVANYVLAQSK